MIGTELDRIHLVLENCEYLDVPGKDVTQLSIRGITKLLEKVFKWEPVDEPPQDGIMGDA